LIPWLADVRPRVALPQLNFELEQLTPCCGLFKTIVHAYLAVHDDA